MWIVKAIDEVNDVCLEENKAWRDVEVEGLIAEYKITRPNAKVVIEEYKPRTKETAEEEIRQKAAALGLPDPFKELAKNKSSKK